MSDIRPIHTGILRTDGFELAHVQQTDNYTCVHSSVSAVTGLPLPSLVKRFGAKSTLTRQEELTALTELGIVPTPIHIANASSFVIGEVYMVTVASINVLGGLHRMILVPLADRLIYVYDPQRGRADRTAYPENLFDWKTLPIADAHHLESLSDHKGTKQRYKLYAQRRQKMGITPITISAFDSASLLIKADYVQVTEGSHKGEWVLATGQKPSHLSEESFAHAT